MSKKFYTNAEVTVIWESSKCIHSGNCVRGLPEVFDAKARPWIKMEGASSERIVAQVEQCPSGALSIKEENTTDMSDQQSDKFSVDVLADGPAKVCGPVTVTMADGSEKFSERDIFLCRCGHSSNKPFCDGSHKREGFSG